MQLHQLRYLSAAVRSRLLGAQSGRSIGTYIIQVGSVSGHRNFRFACSKAAVGKPEMKGRNVTGTSSKRAPIIDQVPTFGPVIRWAPAIQWSRLTSRF